MKSRDFIILFLIAFILFISFKATPSKQEGVVCTMEAKMCPDGSYVGRTGPKCEFSACPNINNKTTAKINETILLGGIYITPLQVLSDSRCPLDAQCIWAGEVKISLRLSDGLTVSQESISTQTPLSFSSHTIQLKSVTPATHSQKTINSDDYSFEFEVLTK